MEALIDSLVKTDARTGRTTIEIPVDSRATVASLLTALGKLIR